MVINPTKFHKCLLRYDEMPGFIAVGTRNKYNSEIYFYTEDGNCFSDKNTPLSWIESPGQKVSPTSLYLFQCAKRNKGEKIL